MQVAAMPLWACFVALASAAPLEYSTLVTQATPDTYTSLLTSAPVVFAHFCVPDDAACELTAGQIDLAAAELEGTAKFIYVHGDADREFCENLGVHAFPTLKVYARGDPQRYRLPTLHQHLVAFARRVAPTAAAAEVTSEKELWRVREAHRIVVAGFFNAASDSHAQAFASMAEADRLSHVFAVSFTASLAAAEGVTPPALVVYANGGRQVMDAAYTEAAVKEHINRHAYPWVSELNTEVHRKLVDRGVPLGWLFVNHDNTVETPAALAVAEALAKGHAGRISMIVAEGREQGGFQRKFGLSGYTLPAFVVHDIAAGQHFVYDEQDDFREDLVHAFLERVLKNEEPPTVRSIPEPGAHTVNGLTTVVGESFRTLVLDRSVDTILLYHATGHEVSTSLVDVLKDVALTFEDTAGVRVAAFETTGNAAPRGYDTHMPGTVLMSRKFTNDLLVHRGPVNAAALEAFVREHALTFLRPEEDARAAEAGRKARAARNTIEREL